ncbi:hypothetical protein I203_103619 [Kwoniella mangroviensis CBS 8507]|uniref:uncharacterized protein n=1 Tax=Kwoniella mangroviensis CBS 8507 TaxID=1296122 RepID=UPI00080D131C|nr:uncharacterized protein I203_04284 [Kwoniella mangroviensis CBS 8507]OCF66708.1 hypothetical protein I203_04284 [Kwoniella mangroviensis CBS 8507]
MPIRTQEDDDSSSSSTKTSISASATSTSGVTGDLTSQGKNYIGSMSSTSFTIMMIVLVIGVIAILFLLWWFTIGKNRRQKKRDLQQFSRQNGSTSATTAVKPGSNSVV